MAEGTSEEPASSSDERDASQSLSVGDWDVLSAGERRRLLVEFNDTGVPFSDGVAVHQLVEECVGLAPGAVAVVCGEERVTYGELNARANRLAHYLMGRGVGRESLVAVCVERGVEMVVALLGVLKAGAAYVPLDPDYPRERLAFMVADTRARLVVTLGRLRERVAGLCESLLVIDEEGERFADASVENPVPQAGPRDLAYVIYTSGSTGTPKGVMIEHRSLSNRMQAMQDYYEIQKSDRTLQFASPAFDASIEQIFPTLMTGGTLLVRPPGLWAPRQFVEYIREQRITVAELTPSMWEQVVDCVTGQEDLGSQFRLLIVGGERVRPETVASWYAVSSTQLLNGYGPTETTITTTVGPLYEGDDPISIGGPVANTEVFVVDEKNQLTPLGTPGELLIGGVGVARGYLNLPELTAERFIPHPFRPDDEQARVYRSGDTVRWLANGTLEFLGRTDDQVKLRGLRIEPGEINSVLVAHPEVASAAVVVREDTPGDPRLVGYCVPVTGHQPTSEALVEWCGKTLPPYMVPGTVVTLDAFPLTPAGKIDRTRLPDPEARRETDEKSPAAPRSETEQLVLQVWEEVLHVENIGIHDNFFSLGGHSLLATRVANQLDVLTDVQIDLKHFFQNPTVADLARHLLDRFQEEG
jgi:amino acid adenylation domain-containing protein